MTRDIGFTPERATKTGPVSPVDSVTSRGPREGAARADGPVSLGSSRGRAARAAPPPPHPCSFPSVGWKGSPVGRPSAARTATDSPGRSCPVVVDGGDPAPLRRGRRGASGQEADDGLRGGRECGGVGGGAPVGEQRPVRGVGPKGPRRQHPDRLVDAGVSDCGHDGLEADSGDSVPDQRGVFPGVHLEHHRGAVPAGLRHRPGDRVAEIVGAVCRMIECASAPARSRSARHCPWSQSHRHWSRIGPC